MTDHQRRLVEEIFLSALDHPAETREGFLDEACGSDRDLRNEVESLLACDPGADQFLESVVKKAAVSLQTDAWIGRLLGPYRIVSEIASGGMGAVYLAERADEEFQKQVAIKVIRGGGDDPHLMERFRAERQILARLEHPYIARLLDGGLTSDKRPYLVMEYVPGSPVHIYCKDHKLSVAQRCRLFLQICTAVSYAHRNLVVHRDLKPSNILVTAEGIPKLVDFGIAKVLSGDGIDRQQTVVAMARLTPDYASPEQVRGDPVTTATDIYSLGAVFYELLTGKRPHGLSTYTTSEILRSVCEAGIARPSEAVTETPLRRQLSGDLDNIVLMAMHKEPGRRYLSAEALADDVKRYLDKRPVRARPDSFGYRTAKFIKRNRAGVVAGVFAVVALLGGLMAASWQAYEARRQHAAAEENRVRAEKRAEQLVALANHLLLDVYDRVNRLPQSKDVQLDIAQSTVRYLDQLSLEAQQDPRLLVVLAQAYKRLGDVLGYPLVRNLGDAPGALREYRSALKALDRALAMNDSSIPAITERVLVCSRMGRMLHEQDRDEEALRVYEQTLPFAKKLDSAAVLSADVLVAIGEFHHEYCNILRQLRPAETLEQATLSLDAFRRARAADPNNVERILDVSQATSDLGASLALNGRMAEAIEQFRENIRLREQVSAVKPGDIHFKRNLMIAYARLADCVGNDVYCLSMGDVKTAEVNYRKALEIARMLAKADPKDRLAQRDVAAAQLRLGIVLRSAADLEESTDLLRWSRNSLQALVTANPNSHGIGVDLGTAEEYLGYRYMAAGRKREARAEFEKSLKLAIEITKANPKLISPKSQILGASRALAMWHAREGQREQALQYAEMFSQIGAELLASSSGPTYRVYGARVWQWNGEVREALGRKEDVTEAAAAYRHALQEWQQFAPFGRQHEVQIAQAGLARVTR